MMKRLIIFATVICIIALIYPHFRSIFYKQHTVPEIDIPEDFHWERPAHFAVEDESDEKPNILADHGTIDTSDHRYFNAGATLGYVTPWNSHGYDVAKWAAPKFTHISPVWFQLWSKREKEKLSCEIVGQHDMDMNWVGDIRKNNSAVSIVPRILFERWPADDLREFLLDRKIQLECSKMLAVFLRNNGMNGAVMECWLQLMSMTKGTAVGYIIEFLDILAEEFRNPKLLLILPIPPPLQSGIGKLAELPKDVVKKILTVVDYLNVMTYDFPSMKPSANAPYPWVEENIKYFRAIEKEMPSKGSKVLMGLNFYGRFRRTDEAGREEPILGNRFLELISKPDSSLIFDPAEGENAVVIEKAHGGKVIAYFPTLKSIKLRLELAKKVNVGIAIWELGQGLDYFTTIL